ncbi:MAG: redoxin domain-containing protein, partial [Gammaproteobacteria bacterium]|nr:redoxin domain-containing protein [Gammaproteobacteria bacterium]
MPCNRRSSTQAATHAASLVALVTVVSGCTSLFPTEPGESLAHFPMQAPQEGEKAPDFQLRDLSGATMRLTELIDDRPIVLQLGSHTCPVYRYRRFGMRELQAEFADRVHLLVVYTLEAHPTGAPSPYSNKEWRPLINRMTGVD